ncbi:outer membrane beta-barrel protein [Flavobacterium sp. 5]|uniref:outer membrane beta-barrel protein n=1 Tax=Flavobacterium sp. 5 TaxID=2035199 RepID=UPI000C2BF032|nr:outer membrane beta-barrel protein [Flavobacterium sp. 5]PKB17208.1 outer membrane protein with beta-barrel domain [Flavobacterium sp. 5]
MKRIFVVLALAIVSFANAQKGTVLLMGTVSYSSQKQKSGNPETRFTQSEFSFYPKVGYQFANNWTIGGEAGISSGRNEYTNQESKRNNCSFGAFVRYSKSLSDLFLIYADLGTGYRTYKDTSSNDFSDPTNYTYKTNGFYATIMPVLAINIKNGFALNFGFGGLNYSTTNRTNSNGYKETGFNFNFGQSFTVGISKIF